MIDNYDERYEGLDKVFYKRELFTQFADEYQCKIKFRNVENEYYWNSKYLFDCYLYKAQQNLEEVVCRRLFLRLEWAGG